VREVERDTEDTAGSTYEVELVRPNGASVEVDLDAGFKVLATDRDDDRRNDSGNPRLIPTFWRPMAVAVTRAWRIR
jgi:hypothetical protein